MTGHLGKRALWFAVLPLALAGSEGAQAVLDRFTTASYRGAELLAPSHTKSLLEIAGVGALLLGAGFAGHIASGCRDRPVSLWMFALVPSFLFVVQEHVEYWIGHGGITGSPAAQWAFLLGLAFQAPFAVAAYIAARLLMRLARAVVARRRPRQFTFEPPAVPRIRDRDQSPRRIQLDGSPVIRGPPGLTVVSS